MFWSMKTKIILMTMGMVFLAGTLIFFSMIPKEEDIIEKEGDKFQMESERVMIYESPNVIWNITKTGLETNIDIDYEVLNDTATEFCIKFNNEDSISNYKDELKTLKRNIRRIPMEVLVGDENVKLKDVIDLSRVSSITDKDCFIITYKEPNVKFKIGWESIIVDSNGLSDATAYGANENICIDSNGIIHIAFDSTGSDAGYANSTDNGASFTSVEIDQSVADHLGIVCMPDDELFFYYQDSNDIRYYNSTDSGITWNGENTLESSDSFDMVSCVGDSNNILHCCMRESTANDLWYVNTSVIEGGFEISADDSDHCDIEVNSSDDVIIAVTDSSGDDLDYMTSVDGWVTRTEVGSTDAVGSSLDVGVSIAIDNNNEMHFAFISDEDLWYCNTTVGTGSCAEIDGDLSYVPDIAVSNTNEIFIFYTGDNDNTAVMYYANSTDGINWDIRNPLINATEIFGFPSIANTMISNNITDTIHYVYTDSSSNVIYNTLEVDDGIDTCTCAGLNENWEIDHSDNCIITEDCDLGTGKLSFTGSGTTTCDARIDTTEMGDIGDGGQLNINDECLIMIS